MISEEVAEYYRRLDEKKWEISKALEKWNEKKKAEIIEKGEIVCSYTCQGCKREFVTEKELKIVPYQEPLCPFCKNGITEKRYLDKEIPADIS